MSVVKTLNLKRKQKFDLNITLDMFLNFQNKSGQQQFLVEAAGVCVCVYLSGAAVRAGVSPAGVMCK